MGYYTQYTLDAPTDVIRWLRTHNECARHAVNGYGIAEDSIKWYEHEEDLVDLSNRFPCALITLSGEGEEGGDLWRKYFRAGRMQNAEAIITYPECTLPEAPEGIESPPDIQQWREREKEKARLRARLEELEREENNTDE